MLPTAFVTNSAVIPGFVNLCSNLAPTTAILVSAAPLPTIRNIKQNQDVGSKPLLPYSTLAVNCMMWTTYGLLQNEASIWLPNVVGLLLALYYVTSFARYAPERSPTLPGSLKQHVNGLIAVGGATMLATATHFLSAKMIGLAAVCFCITLFASPLAAMKTVIQEQSAESIPLPFTMASVINCFLWSVTGILKLHDLNIIIPNVLGLAFGLLQMSLILRYGDRSDKNGFSMATP